MVFLCVTRCVWLLRCEGGSNTRQRLFGHVGAMESAWQSGSAHGEKGRGGGGAVKYTTSNPRKSIWRVLVMFVGHENGKIID